MAEREYEDADDYGYGWRGLVRAITGVLGAVLIALILFVTFRERAVADDALLRATINAGLYTERIFFIAGIIGLMVAVYIVTRADE